jgi:hypothetical protein
MVLKWPWLNARSIIYTHVYAPLLDQQFHNLAALNKAITWQFQNYGLRSLVFYQQFEPASKQLAFDEIIIEQNAIFVFQKQP